MTESQKVQRERQGKRGAARLVLACAALGAALAGCHARWNPLASAPPYHFRSESDPEGPGAIDGEAARLELELSKLGVGPLSPQCERACGLVGEICALSGKLCEISGRHPGDQHYRDFCEGGQKRCQRCTAQVPPVCACPRAPQRQ
jgi:hypothetical protein